MYDVSYPSWVKDAVFYQIMPDRFRFSGEKNYEGWIGTDPTFDRMGGDLWGAAKELDRLKDLGVNAVYLTPIFQAFSYHGYDATDYMHIDERLGGDEAFDHFLDKAHSLDMRVVLDFVLNHTSNEHPWFRALREVTSEDDYREKTQANPLYILEDEVLGSLRLDELADFYSIVSWPDKASNVPLQYHTWNVYRQLPKLNMGNPSLQEYFILLAQHWIKKGIDGMRFDVPEEITDKAFWRRFVRECEVINDEIYLVGEVWKRPIQQGINWVDRGMFDGVMNYQLGRGIIGWVKADGDLNWYEISRSGYQKGHGAHIPHADFDFFDGNAFARHLDDVIHGDGVHDTRRSVRFSQMNVLTTHDTPRLLTMLYDDIEATKLAYFLQFTMPGAPSIWYGEEIGMRGGADPGNRKGFPFLYEGYDGNELYQHIKGLAEMRQEHPALRKGSFIIDHDNTSGDVIAFDRIAEEEAVKVIVNRGDLEAMVAGVKVGPKRGTVIRLD